MLGAPSQQKGRVKKRKKKMSKLKKIILAEREEKKDGEDEGQTIVAVPSAELDATLRVLSTPEVAPAVKEEGTPTVVLSAQEERLERQRQMRVKQSMRLAAQEKSTTAPTVTTTTTATATTTTSTTTATTATTTDIAATGNNNAASPLASLGLSHASTTSGATATPLRVSGIDVAKHRRRSERDQLFSLLAGGAVSRPKNDKTPAREERKWSPARAAARTKERSKVNRESARKEKQRARTMDNWRGVEEPTEEKRDWPSVGGSEAKIAASGAPVWPARTAAVQPSVAGTPAKSTNVWAMRSAKQSQEEEWPKETAPNAWGKEPEVKPRATTTLSALAPSWELKKKTPPTSGADVAKDADAKGLVLGAGSETKAKSRVQEWREKAREAKQEQAVEAKRIAGEQERARAQLQQARQLEGRGSNSRSAQQQQLWQSAEAREPSQESTQATYQLMQRSTKNGSPYSPASQLQQETARSTGQRSRQSPWQLPPGQPARTEQSSSKGSAQSPWRTPQIKEAVPAAGKKTAAGASGSVPLNANPTMWPALPGTSEVPLDEVTKEALEDEEAAKKKKKRRKRNRKRKKNPPTEEELEERRRRELQPSNRVVREYVDHYIRCACAVTHLPPG